LSGTRQSPTLDNEVVYQVQDTRYRNTLGKEVFAECRTLGKDGARQRAVSDRLKLTAVNICRGPVVGTRQRAGGATGRPCPTAGGAAGRPYPAAGGAAGRQRPAADRLRFWRLRFEEHLPTRSRESPSTSHTSGQAAADSAGWGEACNFMFFILVHIMCSKS
jgi:hypothetical protein